MTKQSDVIDDTNYIPVLDHGFAGLVNHLGGDEAITRAARVSYGAGTKKVSEERALIRYLMRHQHSSPFEMVEFTFHLKMPLFVARQLIRHRTASANEYSGRYSIMSDEFYVPDLEQIAGQSSDNKQGRSGIIDAVSKRGVQWLIRAVHDTAYKVYRLLLGERNVDYCDPYDDEDPLLSQEFLGIAREIARIVLPVSNYTEMYWKIDLNNLFKFLRLRLDLHAQYEIRVLAEAIYKLIQPIAPLACEAFEDYMRQGVSLSRMDMTALRKYVDLTTLNQDIESQGGELAFGKAWGLGKREVVDLLTHLRG